MVRDRKIMLRMGGVVLLLVIVVLATILGCAPSASPAVGGKVKVGLAMQYTGPLVSCGVQNTAGQLNYCKWVNDQGGLEYKDPKSGEMKKVLLDIAWEDHAYNVPRALAIYKRQVDWGAVEQMINMSPDALAATVSRTGVPLVSHGQPSEVSMAPKPVFITCVYTSYLDQILAFCQWASKQQSTPPKIGFIMAESPSFRSAAGGGGVATPGLLKEFGAEFAGLEYISMSATDSTIELTRLKAANPDYIYINHSPQGAGVVVNDMQRLGMIGKTKICIIGWGFGEDLVPALGALSEGLYGHECWSFPVETTVPGIKLAHQIFQKYTGQNSTTINIQGILVAMIGLEGIKIALNKVGLEGLTPSAVNDGLHSITDFDTMGLGKPFTITTDFPAGLKYVKVGQIQKGVVQPVSDFIPTNDVVLRFFKK